MAPLVLVAGQTTEEIVCSVKRVADIMGEISAASQGQSAGIEQVNQAVEQMDQMAQQNAALVGQAAAESMQDQAAALAPVVSVFRLDGEEVALKPLIAEKTFFMRKREHIWPKPTSKEHGKKTCCLTRANTEQKVRLPLQ